MFTEDFSQPASVQYGDWTGTVAGDNVDSRLATEFFGIDQKQYRLLAIEIGIFGGRQTLKAFGVDAQTRYEDLEALAARGEPIRARLLKTIEFDPAANFDTNPPPPLAMPVVSATEYLGFGFKRLSLRLVTRYLPSGANLLVEYLEEDDEGYDPSVY